MPQLRPNSPFRPFKLQLSNGATVTGISHIPNRTAATPSSLPLLVGIHGGGCTCYNFDLDANHTASSCSSALGIPFVAINRPSYLDSSTILPLADGHTFYQETARWVHQFILPAIWTEFGEKNGCSGIVTLNHSMAVPIAIVTASLYSRDSACKYPLAGLIIYGFGSHRREQPDLFQIPAGGQVQDVLYPQHVWKNLMLAEDQWQCYDPRILPLLFDSQVSIRIEEMTDLRAQWQTYWKAYAAKIEIPVMYALGEHDWLRQATKETVYGYASFFPRCPRFDASLVLGAPHAIESSLASKGFYARCFGWAAEVCSTKIKTADNNSNAASL